MLTMHYYTLISTFFRNTMRSHVMVMSRASMAAARRILVKMGEHAQKFVSPRAFGTTVLALKSLLADTVSLKEFEKAARPIRLQGKGVLDCTQSLMTAINPSKCFVTFTLSRGLHGTWFSRSDCPKNRYSLVWLQTELDSTQSYYHYNINLMLFWRSRCRRRRRILRSLWN